MIHKNRPENVQRTAAVVQHGRWPGWIWAVPIAALAITSWLALRALTTGGVNITIQFDRAAGMQVGNTTVQYRGILVGKLTGLALSADGQHVVAKVNINDKAKKFLTTGSRFWLRGASPSLSDLATLKAVVAGPTIIMEPGGGKPARHFLGLDHRPPIIGSHGPMIPYRMLFDGAVGRLKIGAPVILRGFTVGGVRRIGLRYNADTGALETPVVVGLDPTRFGIQGLQPENGRWRPVLNQVLERLTSRGLRGRLVQSPPMVGSYGISLDFVPGAPAAGLNASAALPEIPTVSGGGFGSIVNRVNQVPIDRIARQVLQITSRVRSLVSSPQLRESLTHLDRTLAELDRTSRRAGPQITDLVSSLRKTGDELDRTAFAVNNVLGGNPTNQDRNLRVALYEVTEAARSMRSLADYLDRHPEALIRGKDRQ
jgi:paraquat-inducible protein B